MSKTFTLCAAALVIGAGMGGTTFGQDGSGAKNEATKQVESSTDGQSASTDQGKPATSPGWIVLEEDFWYPFRYSLADAIHDAHVDYRHGREKAASDEIKQAMMWMKMAKGMAANKETESYIDIAISDLRDLAMFLDRGDLVNAELMDKTFARAATALAKHHKFNADKAVAKNDLKLAGKHLSTAAYNIREAARCANHEYGSDVVEVFDDFFPNGSYDESVVVETNELKNALDAISAEITTLDKKLEKAAK